MAIAVLFFCLISPPIPKLSTNTNSPSPPAHLHFLHHLSGRQEIRNAKVKFGNLISAATHHRFHPIIQSKQEQYINPATVVNSDLWYSTESKSMQVNFHTVKVIIFIQSKSCSNHRDIADHSVH